MTRAKPAPFAEPIYVTRPLLPPLAALTKRLEAAWDARWLTNAGAQHVALEAELSRVLGAPHLSLFANGTLALLVACRVLGLRGDVVVTPFTFPATVHALAWAGLAPVFADVDAATMTLDPAAVEAALTPATSGVLGVHVYGLPCDVRAFDALAARRGIAMMYDAAHAFGTTIAGAPVASFGDATMFSFHATKLFHTAEGGALAVRDAGVKRNVDLAKNFGIANEFEVLGTGINAKMNELQAALGLCVLEELAAERARRAAVVAAYDAALAGVPGVTPVRPPAGTSDSLQYYVVRIDGAVASADRDTVFARLRGYNVFARKYFFPLASDYPAYRDLPSARAGLLPHAQRAAREVLCLPLYGTLGADGAARVAALLRHCLESE
ncbi:MAG TPA: DegT/DnrJ/EryC1/StrS family aminotransferase [Xanthomonadales bacterium]|nr:DegT/DnrJ/EryC1/StrS family aminotransferase [Xanthomonadales bacterium]